MKRKHAIVRNPRLHGFEYGALRDFESEIIRLTGATPIYPPGRRFPAGIADRIGHGTRYGGLRRAVPKAVLPLEADVTWFILMGPENFELDLYGGWAKGAGFKILYLFDTLAIHLKVLKNILRAARWDLTITSFACAIPFLEECTQRKWHCVPQGVLLDRFAPAPTAQRIIEFSAYGRRMPSVHDKVVEFCAERAGHYDYSVSSELSRNVTPQAAYQQYAWHLSHSAFTFSWPVEMTHPERAGGLSPITCRWFEAAASGAVVVGATPADPSFSTIFGDDAVVQLDPNLDKSDLQAFLADLVEQKEELLARALERRSRHLGSWSWESRAKEIMRLAGIG